MARARIVSLGTLQQHRSGLAVPQSFGQMDRLPDLSQPHAHQQVVNHMLAVDAKGTSAEHQEGREWYPKVHEATVKGVKQHGLDSTLHGAGVVAAVSPQMDFDTKNIHAFGDLAKLSSNPQHMDALHRSLGNVVSGTDKNGKATAKQSRTPEMNSILTKHYPNIAVAPDSNIHKALRIMNGEHPDTVLDPRTAPKTNSFAHNIADPSASVNPHSGGSLATIDGRQHDIGVNNMMTWKTGRGIGTAVAKKGGPTRYEHFANAVGTAAKVMSGETNRNVPPSEVQARTWVIGKRMERTMPGAYGGHGPRRQGQRYV